jgi:hypothetical protein
MLPSNTEPIKTGYKEPLTKVTEGFGYYGTIAYDKTQNYTQCHICGNFFENLGMHVNKKHDKTAADYRREFGLPVTLSLRAPKAKTYQWETWQKLDKKQREKKFQQLAEARTQGMPAAISRKSLYSKNLEGRCPEQLLDKIVTLKHKLGHTPSSTEFVKEYGSGFLGSIKLTFGTWNEAVILLGMSPRKAGGEREYDKENLLDMLRNFYKDKGREPMSSDNAGLLPSRQTYSRHFGSWTNAKQEAGILNMKQEL